MTMPISAPPPLNGQVQMQLPPPQNGNMHRVGSITQTNGVANRSANTTADGAEDGNGGDDDGDNNAISDDAE